MAITVFSIVVRRNRQSRSGRRQIPLAVTNFSHQRVLLTVFTVMLSCLLVSNHETFALTTAASSSSWTAAGLDLGTSGCRISIVNQDKEEVYTKAVAWESDQDGRNPSTWMQAVTQLLAAAVEATTTESESSTVSNLRAVCVSGTSATCLLTSATNGKPTRQPPSRMYNFNVLNSDGTDAISSSGLNAMDHLKKYAPMDNPANAPTSSLAKLLAWHQEKPLSRQERLCHQADYVLQQLITSPTNCGTSSSNNSKDRKPTPSFGVVTSDWHNCLKLGYDVQNLQWPDWIHSCLDVLKLNSDVLLPQVVPPGTVVGTLAPNMLRAIGISSDSNGNDSTILVVTGTTDANAAFMASGSSQWGTAVTSLGSTLAIKFLSRQPVQDATRGVYSHRYPPVLLPESDDNSRNENESKDENTQQAGWLVGGASNVGCAILRQEDFSSEELERLSAQIDPVIDSGLDYYPLCNKGERFPSCDSNKQPCLTPVPGSRARYLHGILEGMAKNVECAGYQALGELGADPVSPTIVYTAGGGSVNAMWTRLRQRVLREACNDKSLAVTQAPNTEASYGAALLALAGAKVENSVSSSNVE